MNPVKLDKTRDTPSVFFDNNTGILTLEGRSLPENAMVFYKPLYDWIIEYASNYKDTGITLDVDLEYLNSSSIKLVFLILNKVDEYYSETKAKDKTCINWKHKKEDELTKLKGEEFKEYLKVPLNLIAID